MQAGEDVVTIRLDVLFVFLASAQVGTATPPPMWLKLPECPRFVSPSLDVIIAAVHFPPAAKPPKIA